MKASDLIALLQLMVARHGDHPVHVFESADGELEKVCNVAYTIIPQGYGWFEIYTERPQQVIQIATHPPALFGDSNAA